MLSLKRDFTRFLDNEAFPQQVVVHVDSEKLVCSGVLLAQQSALIEQLITQSAGVLYLEKVQDIGTTEQKVNCIKYMYGAKLEFSLENISSTIKFASLYGVDDMFNRCCQWMEKNISSRNMGIFHEIPIAFESDKHKTRVNSIINKFISENCDIAGSEISEQMAHGNNVNTDLFLLVISSSPSNGAELLKKWISKSPENKTKVLEIAQDINFVDLFPVQEGFMAFVAELSEGSDSIDSMKQVLALQQSYFVRQSAKDDEKPIETNQLTQQRESQDNQSSSGKADPSSDGQFKSFNEGSKTRQNKSRAQRHHPPKPCQPSRVSQPCKAKGNQADSDKQEKTLFVGNLPPNVSSEEIMAPLNFAGKIKNVDLPPNKNFAFVQFSSDLALKVVLDAAKNGVQFTVKGKVISVQKYLKSGKPKHASSVV